MSEAKRPGRFGELEAFRGIAAAAVVVFHAYQFTRDDSGYVYEGRPIGEVLHQLDSAVAWFFVLSAFLLFLPVVRAAVEQTDRQAVRGFVVRRAIRILPLYWAATVIVWFLRTPSFSNARWRDLLEHMTFTQIYDLEHVFSLIGPAWSLAVEVHFYVLVALTIPLLHALCRRLPDRRGRLALVAGIVVALGVLSLLYKLWLYDVVGRPADDFHLWFGFLAKLDNFALGMLLAVVFVARDGRTVGAGTAWALRLVGAALVVVSFVERVPGEFDLVFFHVLSAVAAALVIGSSVLAERGSRWERVLSARPLAILGLVSYGLYLWHEPLMIELNKRGWIISSDPGMFPWNAVALLAIGIAVAWVSYWVLEFPTGQLRWAFTPEGRPVDLRAHEVPAEASPSTPAPPSAPSAGPPGR